MARGDREQIGVPGNARRNCHHAANAGRPCTSDDGVNLVAEVRKIQMAMAVDQHGFYAGS